MRFKGLMDCDERFTKAFEVAILHYDGADDNEPEGIPTYDNSLYSGIVNIIKINQTNTLFYIDILLIYVYCIHVIITAIKCIE